MLGQVWYLSVSIPDLCSLTYFELVNNNVNDIVSSKIYDKRDDFIFEIVNFPFLKGDNPRSLSYGVYISQLVCLNVSLPLSNWYPGSGVVLDCIDS